MLFDPNKHKEVDQLKEDLKLEIMKRDIVRNSLLATKRRLELRIKALEIATEKNIDVAIAAAKKELGYTT